MKLFKLIFLFTLTFFSYLSYSAPGDLSDECAICLEYKNRGVEVQKLKCGHTYCQVCIEEWSKRDMRDARGKKIENLCPECNAQIQFSGKPIKPSPRRSVTCNIL